MLKKTEVMEILDLIDILEQPHGDLLDKDAILEKAIQNPKRYFDVKKVVDEVTPLIRANAPDYQQLYFCDPRKNTGCLKTNCYWNGGSCMVTLEKGYRLEGDSSKEKKEDN